jgi:alpha-2-macroglobulin
MKRKFYLLGIALTLTIFSSLFFFNSCSHKVGAIDPGFSEYITAFTSGTISVQSTIRIELAKEMSSVQINGEVDEKLFSFKPGINGKAYWIDNRTIEFRPDKPLKQGKDYEVEFDLYKLVKDIPRKFKVFEFSFQTIKQAIAVEIEGYQPNVMTSLTWNNVTGVLRTADYADNAAIEKILEAKQNNNNLKITWTHFDETKTHKFRVDSVQRGEDASQVLLSWNGSSIDADVSGKETVIIPSINDFSALEAKVVQDAQAYISVRFSDPLEANQDLTGLVSFDKSANLTFEVSGMYIKIYSTAPQKGTITVNIEEGIRNVAGARLKKKQTFQVVFESIKPGVRLIGKGIILPNSKGLIFPFEAVSLKAVDLRVIKIFENNVMQFLQVNQLDGTRELKRAGRLILKKTIRLDAEKPVDFNKWNTFSIDLADLIKQEPGAIYRVELSFQQKYSTFPCGDATKDDTKDNMTSVQEADRQDMENEISYWDSPGNGYDEEYEEYEGGYNWEERDDPCKPSYFNGEKAKVSRNVLASDLGIIAKGGADNTLTVAVANLITTKPMGGVEIEVYNFQHQKVAEGKTDNDGFCIIPLKSKPFLLVAKDGTQRGYLRVDDGSALSLSNFDVSGEVVQKGLKGFLYGERGVWRPGDTLFLTFVLEDKLKKLPANHPVVLEVFNPQGQLYKRLVKTSGINGFYPFTFNTNESDPTGNWMAYIKIGGTTFSKSLKIETIKPNRLKIQFDFAAEVLKGTSRATLNAKWLHGAPAKNLKANVTVTLSSATTAFKGYENYQFDDPAKKFQTEEQKIFDGTLNETGNAEVTAEIAANHNSPGMLRANFVTRVFEPGGDFSIDRFSKPYSPYTSYVGIKAPKDEYGYLYTDTSQFFEVVTLSPEGKPISRSGLEFKIYKLEWRWWWDSEEDQTANFANNTYAHPVFSKEISTSNGKANVKYELKYPDWGRFMVRVTDPVSGHTSGKVVYFDWPGWRGRGDRGDGKGATMLNFNADKKSYKVGEKATITVPSSDGGRMLVSLETGSEVLKTWWVETEKKETKASFEITGKMTPNVYIHVSLIQPHAQTKNDLPMRLYGVIPVLVEDPETHLQPLISMPDVIEPEKPVTITVSEKNNHAMTYTLAIVDDGLLDLTRFKTPDPWSSFYGREALGVKSWDLYDLVMGAYGGKIESLFAIGGDDDTKGGAGRKANRFKPVVKVLGPFTLRSGSDKHTVILPQYIGSVRVMVVAGNEDAFGKEEKTVAVRMPLMVLATLPRVVGPGEEVMLPVSVFAMEKRIKNFTVEVEPNEFFQLVDSKSKSVAVNEVGEFDLAFRLKVTSREGVGRVKVIARSGNDKAVFDIELNVRNPNSRMVQYSEAMADAGKSAEIPYTLIGIPGSNKATLEVSSIPPVDLSRRLDYLLTYPYGCIEQTTSGAFPQLFLDNFIELTSDAKARREGNIKYAIQRLNSMMLPDGGFSYWPGDGEANEWGTSYAGHFLLEADKKGYDLPSAFKKNWLNFQRKRARDWTATKSKYNYDRFHDELTQAYRLYTLALAKESEMGAMNRMKEISGLSVSAAWRLAAAYALAGQVEVGKQIVSKSGSEIKSYSRFNATFGSFERDEAMMLETLSLFGNKTEAFAFIKKVSAALSSDQWLSTQTTAYGLLAISKFLETGKSSPETEFTYSGGGKTGVKVNSRVPVVQIKLDVKDAGAAKVSLSNTGKGMLFVRIVTEGIPETGPVNPVENNLKLNVIFKNATGGVIDVSHLEQGTDFIAEVTVKNLYSNYVTNLALKQVFPSGWEIGNDRLDKEGASNENAQFTYQDVRDDRVHTFFDLAYGTSKTFKVRLTASYLGRFYFPGTLCEAMYEPGVNAFMPGKWVEVVK